MEHTPRFACDGRAGATIEGEAVDEEIFLFVLPFLLTLVVAPLASAQIKRPGAHPKYSFELEPHLVLDWGNHDGPGNDEGIGLGLRATIPFLDNGPISKINNNMGIGFGLDWAHNGDAV